MSGAEGRRGRGEPAVGRRLERARAERGLSLEEAARATRIRARCLEGLEREDPGALPDAVYAPVLLKFYADHLGLDGEALARELEHRRLPEREERGASTTRGGPPGGGFRRPSRAGSAGAGGRKKTRAEGRIGPKLIFLARHLGAWALIVLGLAAAVQALTVINDQSGPRPTPSAQTPAEPLRVSISVREAPAWLRVEADGELVLQETAQPGFSRAFEARRQVQIATGNAGAVHVAVNGRSLGAMGSSGEVLTRTYGAGSGG